MPLAISGWSKDKLKHGLKTGLPISLEMKLRLVLAEAEFYKLPAAEPSSFCAFQDWAGQRFIE